LLRSKSEMRLSARALALACALGVHGRPSLPAEDRLRTLQRGDGSEPTIPEKEQPGPEKKCLDAAGEAVWCTSASSVGEASSASDPSPERKSLAQIPEKEPQRLKMKCLDAAGQPVWCTSARSVSNASSASDPSAERKSLAQMPPVGPPSGLSPAQLEIWGPKDFSAKEAPAPRKWVLEDRLHVQREGLANHRHHSCPPGQRNALQDECMEAVQAAAQHEGLEAPVNLKVVDVALEDGSEDDSQDVRWQHDGVPYGCSYGRDGAGAGHALFNSDPAGRSDSSDRGVTYRLACVNDATSTDEGPPRSGALSEAECLEQLSSLPQAVVALHEGLIWCPTAKAGTTSMIDMLNRRFNGNHVDLARSFDAASRLVGKAAEACVPAGSMSPEAKSGFCAQRRALSFSIMRNPWERVVSVYVEKIVAGYNGRLELRERIVHDLGLPADALDAITFPQFVLWLSQTEPDPEDDVHIMPWSVRCGAVAPSNYSMISDTATLDDDLRSLVAALQWDQKLVQDVHARTSIDSCKANSKCVDAMESQLGLGALNVSSSRLLLPAMYALDSEHDLVELVRSRYAEDIIAGKFEFPSPQADGRTS